MRCGRQQERSKPSDSTVKTRSTFSGLIHHPYITHNVQGNFNSLTTRGAWTTIKCVPNVEPGGCLPSSRRLCTVMRYTLLYWTETVPDTCLQSLEGSHQDGKEWRILLLSLQNPAEYRLHRYRDPETGWIFFFF